MEAAEGEQLVEDGEQVVAPPHGGVNELLDVGQEGEMEDFLGPQAQYNEEEEERKYYRRKRLGVIKNVVASSFGAMTVYSVYMGLLQMQLTLHYDMTYREVKYSNLGLEDIDRKMLMGINVTPIIGLLYTPVLIRFLGTKWMMFLASGIYALFVSTNYWERYYTLVPSAVAIGVAIVPFWASLGSYITRMAQQYYEYVNYKEEHVQEQRKLPKGACYSYIITFQSIFYVIFNLSFVFAEFPMRLVLHEHLHENPHVLCNVKTCGAAIKGIIPGFNSTVLKNLPRSMLLIEVESILMGFAFLAMIVFLLLCGPAYRPTEEIDLRSIGWGNIFQLPFKHLRDYRLRLLCPFFIYSGLEMLFIISGFSLSYGVCILGIKTLWLLILVYGLSCSVFSLLSLSLLRLPRWVCLMGGAAVHGVLLVALLALTVKPNSPEYLGPLLVIVVLWGLGSALLSFSASPPDGLSLWLVVWLVLGKPNPASACPHHCVCYPTPMTVSCQAQNFTAVPVGVPYESQRVFLQNNRITELRVGSFGFGTQVLWLFSNNITWIEAGAFSELRDLEELDLGDNPGLHRLEGGAFRGLEKLQSLHMHRCRLTALPHDIFHKLYSLQFLYLQENNLHFLQDDIFSDLINLSQLFLHGNRIRTLSENVFRGLVNLDRLLLHDNRIRQVNRRAFRDLGRLTMLFLFNNSLAELPSQTLRDTQGIEFLRLNANPWSCGCEARALWEWFREAPVSSSEVICASPSTRRGQDLRFLREMDFALCPLPDPGSIAGSTTTTFSTKTRWWFHKNKPQSSTKGIFEKSSETVKAGLYGKGPSTTTSVVKYELADEELALPKLDPEEYWANYGNEDSGVTVRCFELECPPEFDLPPSSSPPRSSSPSLLSLLALSVFTICLHLLFG